MNFLFQHLEFILHNKFHENTLQTQPFLDSTYKKWNVIKEICFNTLNFKVSILIQKWIKALQWKKNS